MYKEPSKCIAMLEAVPIITILSQQNNSVET